ncbi:MAG: hypothetical protein LJF30_09420 [Acidobacteria bacterium]|jgi:hypothetical protein|nr:hypothetical protein [Acidobacteriota bacterium]
MSGKTRNDADGRPRTRTDWGRVADGVGLAGLGVFLLAATVRGLPDGFWIDAVSFWPVLLVSAGIRIVFEKTSLAAGMVLGPLVVLGTLFWLAWGDRPEPLPPGEWLKVTAERPQNAESARVEAEVAGVQVGLETRSLGSRLLVEGRVASREGSPHLDVDDHEGRLDLRLRGRQGGFIIAGTRREVWDLGVTDSLPLDFDLSGAFVRGDLDLRRGWVTGSKVSGAFNAWTFRLPPPSQRVRIHFQGAFSTFDVKVPEGTPVRYDGPGFPLVWGDRGSTQEGIGADAPGYEIELEGAFSVVNIGEGPPPEGGWPAPRTSPETPDPREESAAADQESGGSPAPEAAPLLPAEAEPGAETGSGPPAEDPDGA